MNILLVNPPHGGVGVQGQGGSLTPLNLCALAAWGRSRHPALRFTILDAAARGLDTESAAVEAARMRPDLMGVTCVTAAFDEVAALCGLVRAALPGCLQVLGGPHPSALPERSLRESGADLAVVGEGERAFGRILDRLLGGRGDYAAIPGTATLDRQGNYTPPPPALLVQDLDTLPFPARDLVAPELYAPPPSKRVALGPNTMIASSRGCPHNCGFCAARSVWGRTIRQRSPGNVVSEVEHCVSLGYGSINFTDEFFTASPKRVRSICELMLDKGLRVPWVCSARAQGLDEETLRTMRRANCREISFGIESGDPEVLAAIDKNLDLDEAARVVALAKRAGIRTHASYILGYPGETEDTLRATLRLARKLDTDVAAFFIAAPLPGSRLYDLALARGLIRPGAAWRDYSPLPGRSPAMCLPGLPPQTISRWHRKALRTYYLRPGYLLSKLFGIRSTADALNLLGGLKVLGRLAR